MNKLEPLEMTVGPGEKLTDQQRKDKLYGEYLELQNQIRLTQEKSAGNVPRAVRRVFSHDRKPGTRRARKELARAERATKRRGLLK